MSLVPSFSCLLCAILKMVFYTSYCMHAWLHPSVLSISYPGFITLYPFPLGAMLLASCTVESIHFFPAHCPLQVNPSVSLLLFDSIDYQIIFATIASSILGRVYLCGHYFCYL